jgi:indolepyruvate ferredoxin oxidoreductase
MSAPGYQLSDRAAADRGTVFLSGIQALCRVPIDQLRADGRAGLRTAAFVSGYPGSPLGGFDVAMRAAAALVPELDIVCRPAVNEEYAATAVMGSQLAAGLPDRKVDGVVGVWYGKAPGVDRAVDALRHASYVGTAPHGGALAVVGDDPAAKSSTVPSSSAGVLGDLHVPLLYPADPAEILVLGRHAIAMSRVSGLWAALKIVADVADSTASVDLEATLVEPVIPELAAQLRPRVLEGKLLAPISLELERDIVEVRVPLAKAYVEANGLNRVVAGRDDAWLGIVASGITYREVREAFRRLGLADDDAIAGVGVRLLKLSMPLPFDPSSVREFARGLDEVFVIEEKQPNIEQLVKDALYSLPDRPVIVGKQDERGCNLVPGYGALDGDAIVPHLRSRLAARVGDRLAPEAPHREAIPVLSVTRTPFYCSGCPHNRSTEVPDGAIVGAGIGCHTMTLLMDPDRVGDITAITCMGNEGTQWIGMSNFVERDHSFQNLGDGTYFHSGQLAITAAVAAGVSITYKLLYNDAIAMTGGQAPEGKRPVVSVVKTLLLQGVSEVLITTDEPSTYKRAGLPDGVQVWSRDRLMEAQEHLATVKGVTVLLHDQTCAAELRRRRKRGLAVTPTERVVINDRVCEGCGDCGQISNCLSVQPYDTPYGRKTRIDQTTCNFDYSCLEGDCPAFMTVETSSSDAGDGDAGGPGSADDAPVARVLAQPLPAPAVVVADPDDVTIRMVGIGGTGVVTVAQVLGTAAMLDGFHVRGLDQIGLSQKAGPVVSDVHLTRDHDATSARIGSGQADVLLVFDALVATSHLGVGPTDATRTLVVGSTSNTPPGATITHPDRAVPTFDELERTLARVTRSDHRYWTDALAVTTKAFGDAVTANMLVLGMAVQAGAIPVDPAQVEQAIRLNGSAVDVNLRAFALGRHLVATPSVAGEILTSGPAQRSEPVTPTELATPIAALGVDDDAETEITRFATDLIGYQDLRYALTFLETVTEVATHEHGIDAASHRLTVAAARGLYKLMAYKDEYEVARLLLDADATRAARALGDARTIRYHLHPPLLRALGLHHKIRLGRHSEPTLRRLAKAKRLRGTKLDPFGRTEMRRIERALPGEYRAALATILPRLSADNLPAAVAIANLPDGVRGYERLKLARVAQFRDELAAGVARFAGNQASARP